MLQSSGSFCSFRRLFVVFFATIFLWMFYHQCVAFHVFGSSAPSINAVIAATTTGNYEWAYRLKIPNLVVIPYIANDPAAQYHPPSNKGNEAMIYLSYITEFYDNLPDITIFAHDSENAWHNDMIFGQNLTDTIHSLDLEEVERRGYVNLKVDWQGGCPQWINSSVTIDSPNFSELRSEEIYVRDMFQNMFPGHEVPEIFGGPCCSQFAATRAAIHKLPKEWYQERIDWILKTNLPDYISGRLFERMWAYMWIGTANDCPIEYKALCRVFHICFNDQEELDEWNGAAYLSEKGTRDALADRVTNNHIDDRTEHAVGEIGTWLKRGRDEAVKRGRSKYYRWKIAGDL
ncbi:hypothetical protein HYFRA_00011432 [Hymenoscyphus fraxineus]|uniref:Uncharacterized protein n=1 Tax=Hymenoscyphus fraxineus TaxID=746836 RepID=A0A9N9L2K6_9HELO|nr:hypothetical protein HYFRA_00011432 [Hymenoscyphus fraxineus]